MPVATAQKELPQIFPKPGWVEHDPEEIWRATVEVCRGALAKAKLEAKDLAGIGITNQRETTIVWDRATGKPVYNAIVWQDRRTSEHCAELKKAGHEKMVSEKTGLLLDPYFCGTKIAWILKNVAGARAAADKGALAFGTIESFLLWRLTGGKVHASDATNASRSLLLDIRKGAWDAELCKLLGVPQSMLPTVVDCAAVQWLRDGLHLIEKSSDIEAVAETAHPEHSVYVVPAFVGLGAPYWDADARGAILGLTRDSGPGEIAAATLDSVCYQTRDLVEAMRSDGAQIDELRVDGGMVVNDPLMQRLADTVGAPVERPKVTETTALGAAFLAGLQAGLWPSLEALAETWALDRAFKPAEGAASRDRRYVGWQDAVRRVRST